MSTGNGHLFVLNADIRKLGVDCWALPTNRDMKVEKYWEMAHCVPSFADPNWGDEATRVTPSKDDRVALINVGGDIAKKEGDIQWFIEAIKQYLDWFQSRIDFARKMDDLISAQKLSRKPHNAQKLSLGSRILVNGREGCITRFIRKTQKYRVTFMDGSSGKYDPKEFETVYNMKCCDIKKGRNWRVRHLVAMPLVGLQKGGCAQSAGELISRLLRYLSRRAEISEFDIAIVCYTNVHYSAVQRLRCDLWRKGMPKSIEGLGRKIETIHQLARRVSQNEVVLFIGSGASVGAGLPMWGGLLSKLLSKIKVSKEDEESFWKLSNLDQADCLHCWFKKQGKDLGSVVQKECKTEYVSVIHATLSSLKTKCNITTNYDDCFETARDLGGPPVTVIPEEQAHGSELSNWLLKLHGCVNGRSDNIVLSRSNYLEYDIRRSCLAGLVSGLLLEKHFLICGFSLTDDNFFKIMSSVRNSRDIDSKEVLGTVLWLDPIRLSKDLWTDFNFVQFNEPNFGIGVRNQEIFLDALAALSSPKDAFAFLPEYRPILPPPSVGFVHIFEDWLHALPAELRSHVVMEKLIEFYTERGGKIAASTAETIRESVGSRDPEAGHIFINHSDIRTIACDMWSQPGHSSDVKPKRYWGEYLRGHKHIHNHGVPYVEEAEIMIKRADLPELLKDVPKAQRKAWVLRGDHGKHRVERTSHSSVGVLIDMGLAVSPFMRTQVVGISYADRPSCIILNAQQFLYYAWKILRFSKPRNSRSRHLVALPLLGTGGAGLGNNRGEMISNMLRLFDLATKKYGFDILLVCWDRNTYAAAIEIRKRLLPNLFDVLDESAREQFESLAEKVENQQLGIFLGEMGDFIGMGKSIPSLSSVYDTWARENLSEPQQLRFLSLNQFQKATFIENQISRKGLEALVAKAQRFKLSARQEVVQKSDSDEHIRDEICLLDTLLGQLSVRDFITTSAHTAFESAVNVQHQGQKVHIVSPKCIDRKTFHGGRKKSLWTEGHDIVLTKLNGSLHKENLPLVLTLSDCYSLINQYQAVFARISAALLTKSTLYIGETFQESILLRQLEQIKALSPEIESESSGGAKLISRLTLNDEPEFKILYPRSEQITLQTCERSGRLEVKLNTDDEIDPGIYVTFLASILGHQEISHSMFYKTTSIDEELFITAGASHWVPSKDGLQSSSLSVSEIFFKKIFSKLEPNHLNVRLVDGKFFIIGESLSDIESTKARLIELEIFSEFGLLDGLLTQCCLTLEFQCPIGFSEQNLIQKFSSQFKLDDLELDYYSCRAREIEMCIDYLNALSTPDETFMLDGRFQDRLEETDNKVFLLVHELCSRLEQFYQKRRKKDKGKWRTSPEYVAMQKLCESFGSNSNMMYTRLFRKGGAQFGKAETQLASVSKDLKEKLDASGWARAKKMQTLSKQLKKKLAKDKRKKKKKKQTRVSFQTEA